MSAVDRSTWQQIIKQVVSEGGNLIRPWFDQLEPTSLDHGLLEIRASSEEHRRYCQQHVSRLFTEAAQSATGRLIGVSFVADDGENTAVETVAAPAAQEQEIPLNDEYTFDSLVVGPGNRLANAACQAVSDSPGQAYNPLFLHGSVGLGKTHLLQATCRQIIQRQPDARICMLSCEMFINHFISSVEQGQVKDFRNRYRHVDVLAIDDIQFLSDHERTQEEFFHTFNTLYQSNKQIILSSDRGPAEIPALEERLVSRFNWGLVARIEKPCYETRIAIVRKKAKLRGLEVPEEVVCFIAASIDTNIRELEGAITKVSVMARVQDRPIDLDVAEQAIGPQHVPKQREVTIEDILSAVTGRFNVRLADLQSKKRSRSIAFPRQVCMYLARQLTRHSLEEIGGYFGGRDHSTVLHANRTIESLRGQDPQLQATLDLMVERVRTAKA